MTDRSWTDGSTLVVAEVALATVHLAVVVGFGRLYHDWSFAPDLVLVVVAAHLLAAICRRHVPAPVAALAALAGLALALTWVLFPDTAGNGLPTGATWDAVRTAITDARDEFRAVVAPTVPTSGFQAITVIALWGAVWFADWAAFRLRATIESVAPATVLFVFAAILGSGSHRMLAAGTFAATVLAFVIAHRALRSRQDQAWLSDAPDHGPRSVLRAGAMAAVVALVAGVVVAPHLPGAHDDAVLTWRNQADAGPGNRTTVSPIVDLRRRLVNQSDQVFFTVRAEQPTYWRLTALDDFDGQLWTIDEEFSSVDHVLIRPAATDEDHLLTQTYHIASMDDLWVPVAFQAVEVIQSSEPLRWNDSTATLIVDGGVDGTAGMTYSVTSVIPDHDPGALRSAAGAQPSDIDEMVSLPGSFPTEVAELAQEVTATASTDSRYDQALALQNWFRREFRYSTKVDPGHSDEALLDFLEAREGYCEQFAGTFAAMARSLGIPTRVAVGFTPGELNPATDRYTVRGRHAHAWPEVWFPSVGWVPFEPTPGRGLPGAERYTGVTPDQDDTPGDGPDASTTTTTTTTTAVPTPTSSPPTTSTPARTEVIGTDAGDPPSSAPTSRWAWAGLAVLISAAGWPALLWLIRRARSRPTSTGPAGQVLAAWQGALTSLRRATGLRPDPAETHAEFARRGGEGDAEVAEPLGELGDLVGRAAWHPSSLEATDVERATSLGDRIRQVVDARTTRADRVRRAYSLREALDRP